MTRMKSFLHVGCGPARKANALPVFQGDDWQEVRLDIDRAVSPDVVGSMTDMAAVASESMDAVYSSHNVEHLYPHEVGPALTEFHRVLKPNGFAVVLCPDLQAVCKLVAEGKLLETVYVAPVGPIAPLDMIYGLRSSTQSGNHFMAHKCGFNRDLLFSCLHTAGFKSVAGTTRDGDLALCVVARKDGLPEPEMIAFTQTILFPT